jgi:cytochrome P450
MDIKIPLIVVAFVILLLLCSRLIRGYTKPSSAAALRLPSGPWQLPLIGSLHHLLLSRFSDLPHRALREMSGTYGPLMMLRFGAVPTLVVSSAEAAREVMRTHDLAFCDRSLTVTFDTISCGGKDLIFSPYNAHWRELRKLCMLELFSQRRVLTFRGIREQEVAHLLRSVSGESADGRPVNLSEGICRMINDIAARTVVGNRCKYRDEYMRELDEVVRLAGGFNLADLYPSSRLVRRFSAAARDARRCQRNMYRIIQSIIEEREAMPTPERDEEDLLAVLLRLQKEGGLQFALTNEIVSAVIFVRLAYFNYVKHTTLIQKLKAYYVSFFKLTCSNLISITHANKKN